MSEASRSSRLDRRAWAVLIAAGLVLAVVVTFILQNTADTRIHFLTFSRSLPLGAALLAAAALGGLVVTLLGSLRVLALRRAARKRR